MPRRCCNGPGWMGDALSWGEQNRSLIVYACRFGYLLLGGRGPGLPRPCNALPSPASVFGRERAARTQHRFANCARRACGATLARGRRACVISAYPTGSERARRGMRLVWPCNATASPLHQMRRQPICTICRALRSLVRVYRGWASNARRRRPERWTGPELV